MKELELLQVKWLFGVISPKQQTGIRCHNVSPKSLLNLDIKYLSDFKTWVKSEMEMIYNMGLVMEKGPQIFLRLKEKF